MLYRTRPPQPPRLLLRIAVTATVSSVAAMACFGEVVTSSTFGDGGTDASYPVSSGYNGSSCGGCCGASCGGFSGTSSGMPSGAFDAGGTISYPLDAADLEAAVDAADSASLEDAPSDGAPE